MPNTPCLAPADRARALCAALGLDDPSARETVAAAMREAVEQERHAIRAWLNRWAKQKVQRGQIAKASVLMVAAGYIWTGDYTRSEEPTNARP